MNGTNKTFVKRVKSGLLAVVMLASIFLPLIYQTADVYAISDTTAISTLFPDANLACAIQLQLEKSSPEDTVTQADLDTITTLQCSTWGITSVEGIGYLTNLQTLDLSDNEIAALPAGIGSLMNLTTLNLDRNHLTSLPTEMQNLTHLTSFSAVDQMAVLSSLQMGGGTTLAIRNRTGEIPTITWTTAGTYDGTSLTWSQAGANTLTFASTDSCFSGTIMQNITTGIIISDPTAISTLFPDENLACVIQLQLEKSSPEDTVTQADLDMIIILPFALEQHYLLDMPKP